MIKLTLLTLGRLKEKYLADAVSEYKKRLSRYCALEICEIEPVRLSDKPSDAEIKAALEKEAGFILKKVPAGSKIITLCVEGKEMPSEAFADKISDFCNQGQNITFIIGSSYGLSDTVKNQSDIKLSLSQMTFPHQLFRAMLLEQIYRAFKINEGSTYHK